MTAIRFLALVLLFAGIAAAAEKPLTFDAASLKPTTVPSGVTVDANSISATRREDFERVRRTGGPGTSDPGRIHYPLVSLKVLLEFQEMLRKLIMDRFQLQYHIETRQISGYTLVVARNDPKLKESATVPDAQDGSTGPRGIGPDGFAAIAGNRARMISQRQTMEGFASAVGMVLKAPVADATGLTRNYDFTVTYSGGLGPYGPYASSLGVPEAQDPLPDIFSALQSQLGLKLEPRRMPVEVMVVDHMEKTPIGN